MSDRWRAALGVIVSTETVGWAVTGSAALALHGMATTPHDLDLIADEAGAEHLALALAPLVTSDERPYQRESLRADRRLGLELEEVSVEVLVNLRNLSDAGETNPIDPVRQTSRIGGVSVVRLADLLDIYLAMGRISTAAAISARLGTER